MANVKPRIDQILADYQAERTTSSVIDLLRDIPATEFLQWNGADRADRFMKVLELLLAEQVETEPDFCEWLLQESNLPKLRAIKGIGPKTVDYFKILVGISTSAIDTHLRHFLDMAELRYDGYDEAQAIINSTADILAVDRAHFDHSIWQHMSQKSKASTPGKCKDDKV